MAGYIGRFAPSPTGPLHAGSLVAALASWLDARAHGGQWLVRIEDVDTPRCVPGADRLILQQLADCGLQPDAPPLWQSRRGAIYQRALDALIDAGLAYPCACTRRAIEAAWAARGIAWPRHAEVPYPGTCRSGLAGTAARAWRLRTDFLKQKPGYAGVKCALDAPISGVRDNPFDPSPPRIEGSTVHWHDRRLGAQSQDVEATVGDFVLRRADGLWAYQLAVVVDDALQGVSHVVRGEDLADNTPRQILLQRALALPTPRYLHTPLVRNAAGEKLSKQTHAPALDTRDPLAALNAAATALGLQPQPSHTPLSHALAAWTGEWQRATGVHHQRS
jgi:glutamyl-Q tRNA(Asp) synthetase